MARMRSTSLRTLGLVVVVTGCSEVLVAPDGTGGSSNDGAGAPTGATTTAPTGATSTASFGTQSSATTGGPEVLCPLVLDRGYYVTMTIDGSSYALDMPCIGDELYNAPTGALGGGGECGVWTLLRACAVSDDPEESSTIVFSVPLDAAGTAPAEGSFEDMPFEDVEVTISSYGEVNGIIRGQLSGTVRLPDRTTAEATGDFVVCRIPDTPPCP